MYESTIKALISDGIATKQALLADQHIISATEQAVEVCVATFRAGGKILFCGNGGSAADAQHLAAELSGRFYYDRPPLYAEALHVNTSFLTAVANDYNYEAVFARMVQAAGKPGDILFALSTSGNSPNIVAAAQTALQAGMTVVAMTGASGGRLREYSSIMLNVPSADTPRIQECHMLLGHIICELVEKALFPHQ
ncbi:MAG: SIS domain-containing protein [Saprospiraceae bacterium]|nr:SIS domain-containing protein [Saprospiraceae bacterium]